MRSGFLLKLAFFLVLVAAMFVPNHWWFWVWRVFM